LPIADRYEETRMLNKTRAAAVAALLLGASRAAHAQVPFVINAQTTSGPPTQATASGSSVVDLVQNLIESEAQFSSFQNQAFSASLNYGAIPNAIQFDRNGPGTSATVTIPSTGFTRTFTGTNEADVRKKIEDFLLKEGAKEYARFLRTVNEQSLLGVTDGNPQAATAVFSNSAFFKFGLNRSPMDAGNLAGGTPSGSGLRFDVTGGLVDTDEGDGLYLAGSVSSVSRLGDRIGLSVALPFSYREVEEAKVYMGGIELALPIVVLKPFVGRGIVWQVTPNVIGAAAGSEDLGSGGTFFGGGVTSSLSIPFGNTAALTMGNGLYLFEGYPLDFAGYSWDTNLSQQVMKHGLKLTQNIGPVFLDVGLTYTDFLQNAAIDNYLTPTIGIGTGLGSVGIRVSYQGDFGDGYRSHGGNVAIYLNY
jgi:hypothetical protein